MKNFMSKSKKQPLRCVHRHTIESHPACFAKGLVKQHPFKDEKDFIATTNQAWYNYPDYRIGYFDIESDGLKADFSTMLSYAIKEKDGSIITNVITKDELFNGTYDKRLVKECIEDLRRFKVIVTYNGTLFDLPYMRSKALHYGLEFPSYGDLFHFDLYYTVKSKLNLSRKSLANVCDYLGIKGKTDIDKESWRRAKYGDPEALKEVVRHNIPDVIILEQLHNRLEFSRKWIKSSI